MSERPICSYEGSRYSTEFWTHARTYEDAVERIAIKALLPPTGKTLVEIGAGFGRLADLYAGYETVVLLDYAETQLAQAVERLGDERRENGPQFVYVQANFYHLPFVSGLFDTITMVRTLHHAAEASTVLKGVADALMPEGVFVLEFANKQNLKAIARYLVGRQSWSPFDREPVEFIDLNYDFHPKWIWEALKAAGLDREAVRSVSHYRSEFLKRWIPTSVLVTLDRLAQPTGPLWQLSPSVFVRSRAGNGGTPAAPDAFFRCPACHRPLGGISQDAFACPCGMTWEKQQGIYDFRYPRPEP
jgi:ubiquinone/menaquinone biosynthesis C-methylase UbiE